MLQKVGMMKQTLFFGTY